MFTKRWLRLKFGEQFHMEIGIIGDNKIMYFKGKHPRCRIINYALNFRISLFYILIIYVVVFLTKLAMMKTVSFINDRDVVINITLRRKVR